MRNGVYRFIKIMKLMICVNDLGKKKDAKNGFFDCSNFLLMSNVGNKLR